MASILLGNIISELEKEDVYVYKKDIYKVLIKCFKEAGCNTLEHHLGKDSAFDQAYRELYLT